MRSLGLGPWVVSSPPAAFSWKQQALGWGGGREVVTLLQKHLVFWLYSYSFVFLLNICIQQINEGPQSSPQSFSLKVILTSIPIDWCL